MEISDSIWDEGFPLAELGDLEDTLSTSIDSPELVPFQCSTGPLADEADNSDMTPQCMPVIDPNFVRESFIDGCVTDGVNDVISNGDDILTDYLIGQESGEIVRSLHILICGYCHSVFHSVEEFRSHVSTCDGGDRQEFNYERFSTVTALALVLWTTTVMRRIKQNYLNITDEVELCSRIQTKWSHLNDRSKQIWEKAAEALQELAKVGDLMFPPIQQHPAANQHQVQSCSVTAGQQQPRSNMEQQNGTVSQHNISSEYPLPNDGWEGCDYMDEIELSTGDVMGRKSFGLNCVLDVKSVLPIWKGYDRQEANTSAKSLKQTSIQNSKQSSLQNGEHTAKQENPYQSKRPKQFRDRNGRWQKPAAENSATTTSVLTCHPCSFHTTNPWKMSRHHQTLKHLRQLGLNNGLEGDRQGNNDGIGGEKVPASLDNGVHEDDATIQENGQQGSIPLQILYTATTNNAGPTTKLKRKLDNENNIARPPSKRTSALSASKRMQDWTSILSKR
eukprot:TRINITY_DN16516_c0_g1_i1.p1 TRINITY_DN16516_c0_g1~~TRINITY_DN16516_c0_g1_i1.p1  ORF type:complete len:504 (-),score=68.08 TRINITY_DN16516_c0_g1_i1:195-1706(-)